MGVLEKSNAEKPFSSWKEIAAYLGCDERTCLRWEKKHGLPVHRAGTGTSKSIVFAYKDELDEWLKHRKAGAGFLEREPQADAHQSALYRPALVLGILSTLVLIGLGISRFVVKPRGLDSSQPYDFRIERSSLIITNKKSNELWRYDTGLENLADEASYHEHFGCRKHGPHENSLLPWLKTVDINGDGLREVLFLARSMDDSSPASLICFDSRGRRLWIYEPGREMTFGSRRYSADYAVDAVDVLDMGRNRPKEILVVARHKPNFPSYVAVLSAQGKGLGEYWNSGRFADYAFLDIDNDGLPALVLVGTNNEYGKGFLAVVDPDILWGASPQTGDFQCPDLKPGSELFYILFPRTIVDRLEFGPREAMNFIDLLKQNRLMVTAGSSRIIYELNARMEVETVIISDGFREKYRKYQEAGKIPSGRLNEKALSESLAKGVLYYDGEHWNPNRSFNLKNWRFYHDKEMQARQTTGH